MDGAVVSDVFLVKSFISEGETTIHRMNCDRNKNRKYNIHWMESE